jgi:uncharacterized protein YndB with AHSA1/START domain
MKLLLIAAPIVVALFAAIGTIAIGGMFLPRTHRVTRSVRFAAPADRLWGVITDFSNHPTWRPGLRAVERSADMNNHPVWTETDKHGEKLPIEIVEATAPSRLVGRIADPKLPFGGTWTYELSGDNGGTRLRITEDGEVRPPAFRYIARTMGYSATIEKYLKALAVKIGEEPTIEP